MTNDYLDYIKETKKEIKELNKKLESQIIRNEILKNEISNLRIKNETYNIELINVRKLTNKLQHEYNDLSNQYNNLKDEHDFLAQVVTHLTNQVINYLSN